MQHASEIVHLQHGQHASEQQVCCFYLQSFDIKSGNTDKSYLGVLTAAAATAVVFDPFMLQGKGPLL